MSPAPIIPAMREKTCRLVQGQSTLLHPHPTKKEKKLMRLYLKK
jgi:hypothetical protein